MAITGHTFTEGELVTASKLNAAIDDADFNAATVTATGSTTPRSLAARFTDVVNVLDFIPNSEQAAIKAGNSIYDTSSDFQAALTAINTSGGGQLSVPAGTYKINGNLTVGNDTHIAGSRWGTKLYLGNTNYIHFSGNYSKIEFCEIFKDESNSNYITCGALSISDPAQGRFTWINGCKFDCNSMPSWVNHAQVANYKSFAIKVTNCTFQAPAIAFITKYFDSQRVVFTDNIVSLKVGDTNSAELVKIEAVYEAFVHNNVFYSEGSTASSNLLSLLTLESGSYQTIVSNNKFINDYGYGLRIDNADSPTYPPKECIIENNTFESDVTNAFCIHAGNTATTKFNINNNSFFGKTTLYSGNASFDSNHFYGVGDTSNDAVSLRSDNISFKNNTIHGYKKGLTLASTSSGLMSNLNITGNYFIGQDNNAVELKYLSGTNTFASNVIVHNTSSGNAAVYGLGGGESASADTLTLSNNTVISPNVPAFFINYMNGVTIKKNNTTAVTPYSISNADVYNEDYNAFTTASFVDITARINTEGKYEGKMVFNSTTNKPVYATGPSANSVWYDASGTLAHTPV